MSDITVSINSSGAPSPSVLNAQVGDTVTFVAEADTVLCVDPATVFGAERFEIPAGSPLPLAVEGPSERLDFITRVGDLSASCRDGRDKTGGGSGTVGGGPG